MSKSILIFRRAIIATTIVLAFLAVSASPLIDAASGKQNNPDVTAGQPVISWLVANVSAQRIYHTLYDLQNFSTRYVMNTVQTNLSAQYIYDDFASSPNLIVQSQYFVWNNLLLRNIIAIIPSFNPANKTVYVVGGHYDSWTRESTPGPMVWAPGVDDDGSGTAAIMEIARVLSEYKFNSTIVFGAWTAEEVGLVGSEYYATDAKNKGMQIGAMIQMDMIGNYATNMGLDLGHNGESEWIADVLINANNDYGIGLQLNKGIGGTGSDHASFWAQGYHAIMVVEMDFSPHWHYNTDTIDNVNLTLITRTTKLVAAGLAEIAGIIPPGFGAISLDKEVYKPGDFMGIRLYDTDLNLNPAAQDTAVVSTFSDSEPIGEIVVVQETGSDTSIFEGSIELIQGSPLPGRLEVNHNDEIRAEYIDIDPPGTRIATATVDAVPPQISNIHAIPDIDWATVKWNTNEESDSTVLYGETSSLGSQAHVSDVVLDHSVILSNLKPQTLYYYDVKSADKAGNEVIDSNGGNHYTFMTLIGSMGRPEYGYVGYVKASDPSGNYFTSPDILVGLGYQGVYLGAAQLNTSSTPIPTGAVIISATFEALGWGWIYLSNGQWQLRLLNSSIDAGWTTKGYTDINAAMVDATILPILTQIDLDTDKWNIFTIQPYQYDLLKSHVNSGRISFRMDGPRTGQVSIFYWYTGNQMGTSEMAPTMPRLRIVYSLTGDSEGPIVTTLYASPNPTMYTTSTTINVTISDLMTGGSNLTYAEYFWGSDPGIGNGIPLLADDGGYDSPTESATIPVDLSSTPVGIYTIGFRGCDQSGNWGSVGTLTLYVGVWDLYPPAFDSLDFNPITPESEFPVNVSVRVTDDMAISSVWAVLTNPSGVPLGNFSMAYDSVSDRYYRIFTYNPLGIYQVIIWANDSSNKWNSTFGSFEVVDTTSPIILEISAIPSIQNYGNSITFNAWVIDKFIDKVYLSIRDPFGVPSGNYTTIRLGPPGDNYTYALTFFTLGLWTYCFAAKDLSNQWATSCDYFEIIDGFPPEVISVIVTPSEPKYGQILTITAWVEDPYIDSVWINISEFGGGSIGNFSMTRVSPFEHNWTYSDKFDKIGIYISTVWAYDISRNFASGFAGFEIGDSTPPTFDSVQVVPNPAEVFTWIIISADVTDVQSVTVYAEIRDPTGMVISNNTMIQNQTSGLYEESVKGSILGKYTFSLWAVDGSNNGQKRQGDFTVRDTTKPSISLVQTETNFADGYNDVNVTVEIHDNYGLKQDSLRIEWRDPMGALITNQSLMALGNSQYHFTIRLSTEGQNQFIVTALDLSDNVNVLQDIINVILGQPPVARAGENRNVSVGSELLFDGSASSDDFGIIRYVWRITGPNVDQTLEGVNVNFTFTVVGQYIIQLTVFDSADRSNTSSISVHVFEPEQPPTQGGIDAIVIILIALLIVAAIVMLLLILIKRRRKDSIEDVQKDEE